MVGGHRAEDTYELDLAPMLSMMVTLIPILLLSTAFVQIKIIETPLPQVVAQAIEKSKSNEEPRAEIVIESNLTTGFTVVVNRYKGSAERIIIPNVNGKFNYDGLHQKLYQVKNEFPEIFRVSLRPDVAIPYSEIVKAIDEARRTKTGEASITLIDKEKNESAHTDLMFPEVVFSDVVEG